MKWTKKAAGPIAILIVAGLLWVQSNIEKSHSDISCLIHMGSISSHYKEQIQDDGEPPKKLSDMSSDGWQKSDDYLLPKLIFICPSDPRFSNSIGESEIFYSSYQYYPNGIKSGKSGKSGKSREVLLHCPHHKHNVYKNAEQQGGGSRGDH